MRRLTLLVAFCLLARGTAAQDCNGNGSPDPEDVASGASTDCNSNGRPDECDLAPTSFGFVMDWLAEVGAAAGVAAADLDGDGWRDVAATLSRSQEIAVLPGEEGAFPVTRYFPVSLPPGPLRLADLDGDGDMDAATATADGVSVLWNDGAGGLTGEAALPVRQGLPEAHAADLDRDGDTDLLTLNRNPDGGPSNISVLSNEGGGRFAAARNYAAGDGPLALALADLDGDGDPDAAVVDSGPRVRVIENDGDGRFPRSAVSALRFSATDIIAGAFDRDGNVDLCLSRRGGTVVVLLNRGDGTFAELAQVEASTSIHVTTRMVTADFDGSGSLDVALLGSGAVLRNDGAGRLTVDRVMPGSFGVATGAAADLDLDGDVDLVMGLRNGVGFFSNRPVILSADCNSNGVPDDCEADCNSNRVPDDCDLASGAYEDCNGNTVLDICEADCDRNGSPDDCDIALGTAPDCNGNLVPDSCETRVADCNSSGVPDDCEVASGAAADCNANGIPDVCDVEQGHGFRGIARLSFPSRDGDFAPADVDGDGLVDLMAWDSEMVVLFPDASGADLPQGAVIARGGGPLAVADLDGDGDADACMARGGRHLHASRTDLVLLLQRAGRSFEQMNALALPFGATSLAAADLDADGVQDICLSGDGAIHLLAGRGGGAFAGPAPVFDHGGALTPADLDRDGDIDLLSMEMGQDRVSVLLNSGTGILTERASLPAGAGGLVAEDLDGDGDLDFATGSGHVFANDGHAAFTLRRRLGNVWPYAEDIEAVASADADGDGDLDLFLAEHQILWIQRNDGGMEFQAMDTLNLPSPPRTLAAMDLDGDGRADLVGRSDGEIWRLLNLGEPLAFGRRVQIYGNRAGHTAVLAIDLDGDGDRDLAAAGWSGLVDIHGNDGDGSFTSLQVEVGGVLLALEAADLDGDGDLDVAAGDASQPRVFLLWNDGRLLPRPGEPLSAGGRVSSVAIADLDRDGDPDLAAAGNTSGISLFLNRGGGSFSAAVQVPFPDPQTVVEPLDADGDGDLDLAVGRGFSEAVDAFLFSFLLNDGQAGFDSGGTIPLSGQPTAAGAGDFDGDGRADLAVSMEERDFCGLGCQIRGATSIFLSTESGKLVELRVTDRRFVSATLEVSDLDLDGDLDLALPQTWFLDFDVSFGGTSVDLLLNEGDGTFAPGTPLPTGTGPAAVAAADLDGDGLPDLATVSDRSLSIAFSRVGSPSPDLDRDGVPDECSGARFRRGDADAGGRVDITDAVAILERLFRGRAALPCEKASDANDDGRVDITDPVSLLEHLFRGGRAPPPPGAGCGLDPTPDALACEDSPACA